MVDFSGFSDPKTQMILTMAASLLESSAGGRPLSTGRNTLGSAVGRAGMAGLGAYNQANTMGLRNKLSELQLANALRRKGAQAGLSKMLQPQPAGPDLGGQMTGGGMGPNPMVGPDMKRLGQNPEFLQNLMNLDPAMAMRFLSAQQKPLALRQVRSGDEFLQIGPDGKVHYRSPIDRPTSGRLTNAQQASNKETQSARKWLDDSGMDTDEIYAATREFKTGGRTNPDYSPHIARIARQAQEYMVGGDPDHEKWVRRIAGEPPSQEPVDNPVTADEGDAPYTGPMRRENRRFRRDRDIPLLPAPKPARPSTLDTEAIRSRLPAQLQPGELPRHGRRGSASNPRRLPQNAEDIDRRKLIAGQFYETVRGIAQWDGKNWRLRRVQ